MGEAGAAASIASHCQRTFGYGAVPTGNTVEPTLRHMSTLSAYELDVLWPTVKSLLPHAARTDLHKLLDSLPPESPIELTATPTRIELKTPHALVSVKRSHEGRIGPASVTLTRSDPGRVFQESRMPANVLLSRYPGGTP